MTASTISSIDFPAVRRPSSERLQGVRPMLRKDFAEWRHSRRAWVILVVVSLVTVLTVANAAITTWIIANLPAEAVEEQAPASLAPLDNILAGVASQFFVVVAIFAAMSLLVSERDSGALAWVASKPVPRSSILASKWLSATIVLALVAGLVPLAVSAIVATVLYGAPSIVPVVVVGLGMAAAIAFYVAVGLTAATIVSSQAGVAAIGFTVFFLPMMLVGIIPFQIEPFLPTSILGWAIGLAAGADVGFVTPISFALSLVALGALGARRLGRMEL